MASWKLCAVLLLCVVFVLVTEANGQASEEEVGQGEPDPTSEGDQAISDNGPFRRPGRRRAGRRGGGRHGAGRRNRRRFWRNRPVVRVGQGQGQEGEETGGEEAGNAGVPSRRPGGRRWRGGRRPAQRPVVDANQGQQGEVIGEDQAVNATVPVWRPGRRRGGGRRGGRRPGRRPHPCRGPDRRRCRQSRRQQRQQQRQSADPTSKLSRSMEAFSQSVFARMSEVQADNFVFSPYSLFTAMSMATLGAAGRTKREMLIGLRSRNGLNCTTMMEYNASLAASNDENTTISVANGLFTRPGFNYNPAYGVLLGEFYNTAVQDLQGTTVLGETDPEAPINAWVEEQTNGEISDFLADGSINSDTAMMIINAVYFRGSWEKAFEEENTAMEPFFVSESNSVEVDMMSNWDYYGMKYAPHLAAYVLELPYRGGRHAMFILLPFEGSSLDDVTSRLAEDFSILNETLSSQFLNDHRLVKIPKFALDTSQAMKPILQSLGITSAFDRTTANFRRMSLDQGLYIDEVQHQAVVKVDEAGTVAAAATSVEMIPLSMPINFVVNRPFMFVIRDKQRGVNLFMGRFVNPEGENLAM